MDVTNKICSFVAQLTYESIPGDLFNLVKGYILDLFGVAIYGSEKEWSQIVAARGKDYRSAPICTIFGSGWKASPEIAALVNGTMSHAFELDDFHELDHPGAVVVPAALAVAEANQCSGKEFLIGVIAGYEVMCRVGLVMGTPHLLKGFHGTGTVGTFGSATAAGKLLNNNEDQLIHTMGIAGSLGSGLMEFSQTGGMIKRLHAGRAAEGGVLAAYLARSGFTGPTSVFEGKYGFCRTFCDEPDINRLTDNLGTNYVIREMTIKPYACCGDLHPTIDAILMMKQEYAIDPELVEHILVETTTKGVEQNAIYDINSIMAAQYSIPFSAAATLLHDIRDPRTFSDDVYNSTAVRDLISKVEMTKDKEFDSIYPRQIASRVIVRLRDGQQHAITVQASKGSPQNPMTSIEIEDKFMRLTADILPLGRSEKIKDLVINLEHLGDVSELTCLLEK